MEEGPKSSRRPEQESEEWQCVEWEPIRSEECFLEREPPE